jgi:hypothetical protein
MEKGRVGDQEHARDDESEHGRDAKDTGDRGLENKPQDQAEPPA